MRIIIRFMKDEHFFKINSVKFKLLPIFFVQKLGLPMTDI